jgi:CBS domain-containing protein
MTHSTEHSLRGFRSADIQETQISGMRIALSPLRYVIMKVSDILQVKGSVVKTVRPDTSARELSVQLRAEQIGAMIVSNDGKSIDGLVSERDLAYALAAHGEQLPKLTVAQLMTKVIACSPEDSITDVMKLMTQRRVRHLPVKEGDQLVGIISIGDLLKHRLDEVELEANVMRDYAIAARR